MIMKNHKAHQKEIHEPVSEMEKEGSENPQERVSEAGKIGSENPQEPAPEMEKVNSEPASEIPQPETQTNENTSSEPAEALQTVTEVTLPITEWERLKQEAETWKDKYIRLLAEFDNYKKRIAKEKTLLKESTEEALWKALLPIIDDIERALEVALQTEEPETLREGLQLLLKKIHDFLRKHEIEPIEAKGQPFDSTLHEAIANQEVEEALKGIVIEQVQKGYKRKGQVIRYAKVITGK